MASSETLKTFLAVQNLLAELGTVELQVKAFEVAKAATPEIAAVSAKIQVKLAALPSDGDRKRVLDFVANEMEHGLLTKEKKEPAKKRAPKAAKAAPEATAQAAN